MIVVFDTNIYDSAFALPEGSGERALQRIMEGQDSLVISKPILDELMTVLARKFAHDREQLARTAVFLADLPSFVSPSVTLSVLEDEPDYRILECPVTASADVVVTGDRAMLELGEFNDIRILLPGTNLATE